MHNPFEHYRYCRSLYLQKETPRQQIEHALRFPSARNYQPSIAVSALLARRLGLDFPPVVPRILFSGAPSAFIQDRATEGAPLPIALAEELSLLWEELGLAVEAKQAGDWASRFNGCARWLYTPEKIFFSEKVPFSANGKIAADPNLGLLSLSFPELDAAFSLTGSNSALGALQINGVSFRAIGPQTVPLSDPLGFGVSQLYGHGGVLITEKERGELEGWTRCHGSKESWLFFRVETTPQACELHFRLPSGNNLKIAFYIAAERSLLERSRRVFQPGSLQQYQGKAEPLLLNDSVRLECLREGEEMQIIPLAGKDCFWNANYLIAFDFPPNERISFRFEFK